MITYRRLEKDELCSGFLSHFNKYQEMEPWSEESKHKIVTELIETIANGGAVFAAFDRSDLLGFSSIEHNKIGSNKQYALLNQLLVDYNHRCKGIGRNLFIFSCQFAKSLGASKLYISAHSSKESQAFYTKLGCVDAMEIDQKLNELQPHNVYLEYLL